LVVSQEHLLNQSFGLSEIDLGAVLLSDSLESFFEVSRRNLSVALGVELIHDLVGNRIHGGRKCLQSEELSDLLLVFKCAVKSLSGDCSFRVGICSREDIGNKSVECN